MKHINDLKTTCIKSMNVLKYLNNRKFGLLENKLLSIYRTVIRSKIDYGSQIYSTASKTTLKKLDTIHNACLRICCGAFRTTPSMSICCITDEPPLIFRRMLLSSNPILQTLKTHNHPSYQSLHSNITKSVFLSKNKHNLRISLDLQEKGINTHYHPLQSIYSNPSPLGCCQTFISS